MENTSGSLVQLLAADCAAIILTGGSEKKVTRKYVATENIGMVADFSAIGVFRAYINRWTG